MTIDLIANLCRITMELCTFSTDLDISYMLLVYVSHIVQFIYIKYLHILHLVLIITVTGLKAYFALLQSTEISILFIASFLGFSTGNYIFSCVQIIKANCCIYFICPNCILPFLKVTEYSISSSRSLVQTKTAD